MQDYDGLCLKNQTMNGGRIAVEIYNHELLAYYLLPENPSVQAGTK